MRAATDGGDDAAAFGQLRGQVIGAVVTDQPLELLAQQATTDTLTDAMGALVRFDGIVRDHDGGQRVRTLAYEAHPSATDELRRVAAEVAAVTGALLLPHVSDPGLAMGVLFASLVLWALSVPVALSILTILFLRLALHKLPPATMAPSTVVLL